MWDEITYPFPNFIGCIIEVLGMKTWSYPTLYNLYNYLLRWKILHVSRRGHRGHLNNLQSSTNMWRMVLKMHCQLRTSRVSYTCTIQHPVTVDKDTLLKSYEHIYFILSTPLDKCSRKVGANANDLTCTEQWVLKKHPTHFHRVIKRNCIHNVEKQYRKCTRSLRPLPSPYFQLSS